MTTNLTQPISKKLLAALLIITFGAEAALYLMRYSSLASSLYDAIMVSSIFIGYRLHPQLAKPRIIEKTKLQISMQFIAAFLFFFIGSTFINIYSTNVFQDFSNDYDQYVQSYTDNGTNTDDQTVSSGRPQTSSFFDKVDTVGADLYTDALAGLEEVWRIAYMMLILFVCKFFFKRRWESGSRDIFIMVALFISSIVFGIDHTLDAEQPWAIKLGSIITFANMGLLFGLIMLWTRNLWLTVFVHALYDMATTLSWYYFDYTVEVLALVLLVVLLVLLSIETYRRKQKQQLETEKALEV
jgi:hypothetical protein